MEPKQVIILGAGFAGLAAARALKRALRTSACSVTLIDRNTTTAMIPALPDYAAGLLEADCITAPIASQIPKGTRFLQTQILNMQLAGSTVETEAGPLHFDYLILAMGSKAPTPTDSLAGIPTYPLTNLNDAIALRKAFDQHLTNNPSPEVVISGAGYTGVELAICMARRARKDGLPLSIHLVERMPGIMPFLTPGQNQRVSGSLERHGIHLHTSCQIQKADAQTILLSDGTTLAKALVCRTEGTCAPVSPQEAAPLSLPDGRIKTESTLALTGFPHVYAAGDAAAFTIPAGFLRKAVNFAFYAGGHAGRNIARQLQGRPPRPFLPVDLGWVIPLGDDSVGKAFAHMPLCGRTGLRLHYVMCGYRNYSIRNFMYLLGHAVRAGKTHKQKG